MKKSSVIALILTLFGLVFVMGCQTKQDPAPSSKSKTQLLVTHSWSITNSTSDVAVNYDGDVSTAAGTDVWAQKKDCEKDDYLYFSGSGNPKTGYRSESTQVCMTPAVTNFTWAFNTLETVITFTYGAVSYDAKLLKLDETTLKLSYAAIDADGLAYTQTDTYSKK